MKRCLLVVSLCGAIASCGESTDPSDRVLASVHVLSGDAQSGVVGKELMNALTAETRNAQGQPISGQIVNFVVVKGGGSVFAGSSLSDANGIVRERWTLGTSVADSQVVEARSVNSAGEPVVYGRFIATPLPDVAKTIATVSGTGQTAAAGAALGDSLLGQVRDQYGNPVPGTALTWTISAGGGSLSRTSDQSSATGHVSTKWTVGTTPGAGAVTATASALTGAAFSASITAAAAAKIVLLGADTLTKLPNARFDIAGRVVDQYGNPVSGVMVQLCRLVSPAQQCDPAAHGVTGVITNAAGVATFADQAVPTAAGYYRYDLASRLADPLLTPTGLTVRTIQDVAAKIEKAITSADTLTPGTPLSPGPEVIVKDQWGNATPGVSVRFRVLAGNGSIGGSTDTTIVTDVDGKAGVAWMAGPRTAFNYLTATLPAASVPDPGAPNGVRWQLTARHRTEGHTVSFHIDRKDWSTGSYGSCLDIMVSKAGVRTPVSVKTDIPGYATTFPGSEFTDGGRRGWFSMLGAPAGLVDLVLLATYDNGDKVSSLQTIRHNPALSSGIDCSTVSNTP